MITLMHYLRMLTNSLIAGALVGAYVALLVLQLNPMVRLDSMAVARLMLTWAAFYGVHAAAFFYAPHRAPPAACRRSAFAGMDQPAAARRVRHDCGVDERASSPG